jgi:hypothetical protein
MTRLGPSKKPKPKTRPPFALLALPLTVALLSYGCGHSSDLIKEAPTVLPDIAGGAIQVLTNPGSLQGWVNILGGVAALAAVLVGGKVGYNKVRTFIGKPTDTDPAP